jgi:hypothetical protein
VVVRWIPTDQNWADIFTKPLSAEKFYKFWKQMCGYEPWQVPDGTTTAAGATKFEFVEFTHWQIDTAQAEDLRLAQVAQKLTSRPVDDVVAPVLWTVLTSPKSDLGDGGASTDHEHQQQSDTRVQCYRHCKEWGDKITTRRCTCDCVLYKRHVC